MMQLRKILQLFKYFINTNFKYSLNDLLIDYTDYSSIDSI